MNIAPAVLSSFTCSTFYTNFRLCNGQQVQVNSAVGTPSKTTETGRQQMLRATIGFIPIDHLIQCRTLEELKKRFKRTASGMRSWTDFFGVPLSGKTEVHDGPELARGFQMDAARARRILPRLTVARRVFVSAVA
jgi:hypothetical protein